MRRPRSEECFSGLGLGGGGGGSVTKSFIHQVALIQVVGLCDLTIQKVV
jgi:hypothetical protein